MDGVAQSPEARTQRISCRCCSAACGMVATVVGDRVVKVEGDRSHPISRGYTCAKGRSIAERHHDPSRLDRPRLHGAETSWDAILADLTGKLAAMREAFGPNSVGVFGGTGGAYDTLGWWASNKLVRALGTAQYYTVATVDTAPLYRAAELVCGYTNTLPHWVPDLPGPSLAILLGLNPCVAHGYLGGDWPNPVQRLREYRNRGGELWTVDPRRTKTARNSDRHLATRPGSDPVLLAWLIREVMADGYDRDEIERHCAPADVEALRAAVQPFTLAVAAARTGVAEAELLDLIAAVRRHGKIAVLSGTGIAFNRHGLLSDWLRWALLILTGSLDTPGGMFFTVTSLARLEARDWTDPAPPEGRQNPGAPSRPELVDFLGQRPATALIDEIEAGSLKALIVFGGNPLVALPDAERAAAALARLEVLAVVEPFDNDLSRLATHVLPTTWMLERSDIRQRPTRIEYSAALVPGAEDRRPGWRILGAVAAGLGIDLFGDALDVETCDEASVYRQMLAHARVTHEDLAAAGMDGLPTPHLTGWFHDRVLGQRGWRIAPKPMLEQLRGLHATLGLEAAQVVLVTGRVDFATNSVVYPPAARKNAIPPEIHLSADVAAEHGLADGDRVAISTDFGELAGQARVDGDLHRGTVWMNHGWTRRNVNRLIDSRDIDLLTTQPYFSAIPVMVRAADRSELPLTEELKSVV